MTSLPNLLPLQSYGGAPPPAPEWFTRALAVPHEAIAVTHDGARLEVLAWGERGLPGLLLMHGNRAHARWWSPLAGLLAGRYRIAALSWSGMGRSGWREHYSDAGFAAEALAAAEGAGLFDGGRPVFVAHSFGCGPMLAGLARYGERIAGGLVLDTWISRHTLRSEVALKDTHRVYPSPAAALERFRLLPRQDCANHYYVDWIARNALTEVTDTAGRVTGWCWSFDPQLWSRIARLDKWESAAAARCPLALVYGEFSAARDEAALAALRDHLPAATRIETLAGAAHHLMLDQPLATADLIDRIAAELLADAQRASSESGRP